MFGDVGLVMLKMMGHSATVPGTILVADVHFALYKLKSAIETGKISAPVEDQDDDELKVKHGKSIIASYWSSCCVCKDRLQRHVDMNALPFVTGQWC